ncbi:MAG TPA: pilus assembly protein PilM [Oligoflexia bacterium]|nr:pilus assembly protein PilM [Oligoflexia bacterium]HMR25551.1 pilus assembly protein PilM [Oligoflexia bacterium]
MSEKILGLDIGTFSIKAALFESSFTQSELVNIYESAPLNIGEHDNHEQLVIKQVDAIKQLIADNRIEFKTVISSIPSTLVSFKPMVLPLSKTQIEKILPFEMENFLPFSIDEMTFDHDLLKYEKPNSHILAAAIKNQYIQEHLDLLQQANIDPAIVTTDACDLNNALMLDPQRNLPEHYGILHLGHRCSYLVFIHHGKIQHIRSQFFGGAHLTEAIRKNLDLTLEQAIEVKHSHGVLELPSNPLRSEDLKKLSETLYTAFVNPLNQIKQNIGLYRASTQLELPLEKLYLNGGSSQLKNLPAWMSSQINLPCELMDSVPYEHPFKSQLQDKEASLNLSIGLGLRAAAKGKQLQKISHIDLRKNDFAFAKDLSDINKIAIFFGKWITAIFIVAILFQTIRFAQLRGQYRQSENNILKKFSSVLPKVKRKPTNSEMALRTLKNEVNHYEEKQRILTAGLGEETALSVLKTISNIISPDISIDVKELSIDNNKVTLNALTSSFQDVDRIVSSLKEHKTFSTIDLGDRKESGDNKVNFTLTITIESEETKTAQERKNSTRRRR